MGSHRVLVHVSRAEHRVVDADEIYCLLGRGGETEVRLRSRTPLVDVRELGEVAPLLEPFGIIRIHRGHAVNVAHVSLVRLQGDGRDWEVKLGPPVNLVLPVSRDGLASLRRALGEPDG